MCNEKNAFYLTLKRHIHVDYLKSTFAVNGALTHLVEASNLKSGDNKRIITILFRFKGSKNVIAFYWYY